MPAERSLSAVVEPVSVVQRPAKPAKHILYAESRCEIETDWRHSSTQSTKQSPPLPAADIKRCAPTQIIVHAIKLPSPPALYLSLGTVLPIAAQSNPFLAALVPSSRPV